VVENLAALDGYPSGFGAAYASNVVSREEDVAAVVAKIELGEGDAAIVYVTDALASSRVTTIEIPDGATVRATYAGVAIGDYTEIPEQIDRERSFIDWLAGSGGQRVLAEYGFEPPP
jgi:molybdate transport system substrate-binding protein